MTLQQFSKTNPNPAVGETITITATIHNNGSAPAENVLVQFFDSDPSTEGIIIVSIKTYDII